MLFLIFLKQELFRNCKNHGKFLQNILFFFLNSFVFLLISQNMQSQENQAFVIELIIWFSLLFSIFFTNSEIFQEDFLDGTLEQIIIFCENLEIYTISKILASWLVFCLPIILASNFLVFLFGYKIESITNFNILLIFSSLAISFAAALCSSFNIASNRASLLAILVFPLIIPVLLISFAKSALILAALAIFLMAISVLAATKIIKIISDF